MVSWGKGLNLQSFTAINQAQKENQVIPGREINAMAQRIKKKEAIILGESYCIIQEVEQGRKLNLKS